ncbi:DUF885 domain-containing protein [Microbulbifer sp. TRSA002]|uniref:DUF885 domain-containing protein n=1 Tax=Microbulbifer sp. TRSA002 TaxID=3243382 RepID=UPI0040393E2E
MINIKKVGLGILAVSSVLMGCSVTDNKTSMTGKEAVDDSEVLHHLADQYAEVYLENSQPYAYFFDIELDRHNLFLSNSPNSSVAQASSEDKILSKLEEIDLSELKSDHEKVFYFKLKERLESNVGLRICKTELWSIDHMFGAHNILGFLVEAQPVESTQDKADAIERWLDAARYYEQEIDNLSRGLEQGYSAPQSVVKRVLQQIDGLIQVPIEEHPFLGLAKKAEDPEFEAAFKQVLSDHIIPSMTNYRNFLESTYLPEARAELGIHAIPNGRECYMAQYRSYTTLQRTPEEVFELGLSAVNANKSEVIHLGEELYQVSSFDEAVANASEDKTQKFNSAAEMHQFYERLVDKSRDLTVDFFHEMPLIEMEVKGIPEHEQGSGRGAHYIPGGKGRKARFEYDPTTYKDESYASAEKITIHEGYPGHHMQIALVQGQEKFHKIEDALSNAAFSEGWGRYSEHLAEEAGMYQYGATKILRRAWPARGMVADTAMHVLGWSDEKVAQFLQDSGASYAKDPRTLMDRMAVIPAQLASYDSGALEIFALRELMQNELGEDFDIKDFHEIILRNGNVPMAVLNEQVREFIKNRKQG